MQMPRNSTDLAPFRAFTCSEPGAALARAVAEAGGWPAGEVQAGGLTAAARLGGAVPLARHLLVEAEDAAPDTLAPYVAALTGPETGLVVVGPRNEIGTYKAVLAAGATDYLPLDASPGEVLSALRRGPEHAPPADPAPPGPVLCVTGTGGAGASALAQNLAALAARPAEMQAALIDLDLLQGSTAADLDSGSDTGLVEALASPARIDRTFLDASMTRVADRLAMYCAHLPPGPPREDLEARMPELVRRVRTLVDVTVLDAPAALLMRRPDLLASCDRLVVVLSPGFSALHRYSRIAALAAETPDAPEIVPVLSALRRDAGLAQRDVAKTVGHRSLATLPRCEGAFQKAYRKGLPLAAMTRRGPYDRALRRLYASLTAETARKVAPARSGRRAR